MLQLLPLNLLVGRANKVHRIPNLHALRFSVG